MALISTTLGPMDEAALTRTTSIQNTPTGDAHVTQYWHEGQVVRQDVTFYANDGFLALMAGDPGTT